MAPNSSGAACALARRRAHVLEQVGEQVVPGAAAGAQEHGVGEAGGPAGQALDQRVATRVGAGRQPLDQDSCDQQDDRADRQGDGEGVRRGARHRPGLARGRAEHGEVEQAHHGYAEDVAGLHRGGDHAGGGAGVVCCDAGDDGADHRAHAEGLADTGEDEGGGELPRGQARARGRGGRGDGAVAERGEHVAHGQDLAAQDRHDARGGERDQQEGQRARSVGEP
jgi:transcription termination factor Rho